VGRPETTRRVLRGGSWNNNRDNARCAYRNHNDPGNRNNNVGLRLVCVSHIVHAFRKPDPRGPGRKCPSPKVGGPRRRCCGWRRLVPSARIAHQGAHRRAYIEEGRRPGASSAAPRPSTTLAHGQA